MSAASNKMTEMIPSTSAHLIDRSEDVIFELVWVIKRSILSFPVYITKKKVTSVIDSAVLHWTMWLMVFPRNAGFGRCYLGSTRHEILSNIDRNLTGTRLWLRKNLGKTISHIVQCNTAESITDVWTLGAGWRRWLNLAKSRARCTKLLSLTSLGT